LRTVLTTLAVVFGVTVLFGLESILPAMLQALRQNMLASAGKVDLTVSTTANGVFDATYLEQLRGVAGIGRATGALQQPLILPAALTNTLAINVIERTREIGMLRAVGSTRQQIRRMIQAESLLLAALGTACGILAGLWLSYVLVQALNASGFMLDYYFPYAGILGAIAVGLLFGVLAATIPARQAARMDIVAALRYE
jgi:ABC-type antimicrobial peptide transport system permease subunit